MATEQEQVQKQVHVQVEFTGGLESLFRGRRTITLAMGTGSSVGTLIARLRDEHLGERPELFVQNETIRPGILVLINEVDWELEGGLEYGLREGDKILFISTLHGG